MKAKSILSSLILIVFAILGGGSVDSVNYVLIGILVIIGGIILIGVPLEFYGVKQKKKKEEEKRMEKEAKQAEYIAQKKHFFAANGTPDKTIVVRELDLNSEIHVYENSKKVFIMGKEYSFKDVLACSVSSQERIEKGNVTAVTESNNGSVIGRAIVGDIIAGPAGAIIGGTTAEKRTIISQDDDKVVRDYTVNITMNSISDPIINIHTGEDVKLTNEVISLMNVIISNK
jgi:hypothetical protein